MLVSRSIEVSCLKPCICGRSTGHSECCFMLLDSVMLSASPSNRRTGGLLQGAAQRSGGRHKSQLVSNPRGFQVRGFRLK